jgi:hypothetical protein
MHSHSIAVELEVNLGISCRTTGPGVRVFLGSADPDDLDPDLVGDGLEVSAVAHPLLRNSPADRVGHP